MTYCLKMRGSEENRLTLMVRRKEDSQIDPDFDAILVIAVTRTESQDRAIVKGACLTSGFLQCHAIQVERLHLLLKIV